MLEYILKKMKYKFIVTLLVVISLYACKKKPYIGIYKSAGCMILEEVEVYPDKTADVSYVGLKGAGNYPCSVEGDSMIIIREKHREWYFLYRNDTLFERSRYDYNCFLVKKNE